MTRRWGSGLAALLALAIVSASSAAWAQSYPPPPGAGPGAGPPPSQPPSTVGPDGYFQRWGLYGGFGLALGNLSYDYDGADEDQHRAAGVHGDIGWRINPRVGISLDGFVMFYPEEDYYGDTVILHVVNTIALQYWATPQLWLKGGLGLAQLQRSYGDGGPNDVSETVGGLLLGAGYEVLSTPGFSMDLGLRIGTGFYDGANVTNAAVTFSVNWHSMLRRYAYAY